MNLNLSNNSSCPPAPPPLPSFQETISKKNALAVEEYYNELNEKDYLINLWKSLKPSNLISDCSFYYSQLKPILQEGPTCGLVALAMLCSAAEKSIDLSDIIHRAKQAGYSQKGEMFSSYDMTSLSLSVISDYFKIVHNTTGMHTNKGSILACLQEGGFILVPYDADKNHSPAMLKGHKAHWAVLCGYIDDLEKVLLIARQGKSKYPALWEFNTLADSNANLVEVSQERINEEYIIHDIKATLAGHYIQFDMISPSGLVDCD